MNNELLLKIIDQLETIGAFAIANFILGVVFISWYLFNEFIKDLVNKFYAKIERRKKEEKEMAQMGKYIENQFKK